MFSEMVLLTIILGSVAALVFIALWVRFRPYLSTLTNIPFVIKIALLACGMSFYLHGSLKTNNIIKIKSPSKIAAKPISSRLETINETDLYVDAWNTIGVWEDSFWCRFENDFVFPFGTNHLKGVEVLAWGEIWSTHRKDAVLAELGEKVAIGRSISQFSCEYFAASETNESKYVYSWYNSLVNRETNSVINGRIELRRSGDILVATNGIERLIPRQLPFEHNGFGQDDEWVAANFTNSNEILSVGYSQWVDDQVGVDLTNGLYKLTVTVPEKPLETTFLTVGDYSVAVTNAGEYVFLLEKGVEYQFATYPFMESATYSWSDDLENNSYSEFEEQSIEDGVGVWSEDGGVDVYLPTNYNPGIILWLPQLKGYPDIVHLKESSFPKSFYALLSDCRLEESSIYCQWVTADDRISIVSPNSRETLVNVDEVPRREDFDLSVRVRIANRMLYSTLIGATYGTNENPMVTCAISAPSALILRSKQMAGSKPGSVVVSMISDVETNGILRVSLVECEERVVVSPSLPKEISIDNSSSYTYKFNIDGAEESAQNGDVKLKCEFVDTSSNSIAAETALTVLNPSSLTIRGAPDTGMCVVKGTPIDAFFEVLPSDTVVRPKVEWYTARRRNNGNYDGWQLLYNAGRDASIPTPSAGVFALKARLVYGTQSNETAYVHMESEGYCQEIKERIGPCEEGDYDHFGVTRSEGMLRLRNAALSHLGLAEYRKNMFLSERNGFSSVKVGSWKCNRFVADIAIEAGFSVPHNQTWTLGNVYPPVANDWAKGIGLGDWLHLGNVYPEPGFIAGRFNSTASGHCGIVDYDGWTISARPDGVGRNAKKMLDGTVKYNAK